ncbi:MAG: hypothetical protein IKM08_07370 [Clostridia bacterium]|nr:hypothetical protein [Clostridia bacterium]
MEFIAYIIVGIIFMVVLNLILDKVYGRFPLLHMIVICIFAIASLLVLLFSTEGDGSGVLYGVLQFLCFYNMFIEVESEEWTTRETKGSWNWSGDTYTVTSQDVNHWRPAWWNKLLICAVFTAIACLISLLIGAWWAYLIPTAFEVFVGVKLWLARR